MTTLFSPVGTADPFTQLGDGPLVHIVRHRRPDSVVLFLSPAMSWYQQKDGRYTRAIELLSQEMGCEPPEIRLVESSCEEVYRFDLYIEEFERILQELASLGEPTLVNVSSGTAGMSQALVALGSFGRLHLELIQVLTPKRGINTRNDREDPANYDFDAMWEWVCEVEKGGMDRTLAVRTPNFSERLLRENVVSLIREFDYESANQLAQDSRVISTRAKDMIRAAADRLNLDGQRPAQVFGGMDVCYMPNDLLGEYLSVMEVRLAQGHWAEFLRSLTPALTTIMAQVLEEYLPARRYQMLDKGKPTGKVNLEAVHSDARLTSVLDRKGRLHADEYITNGMYAALIEEYCSDGQIAAAIRQLRDAESGCRNKLAHRLTSSSKATIEKECGMSLEAIMKSLFGLYGVQGKKEPGLYLRINEHILLEMV